MSWDGGGREAGSIEPASPAEDHGQSLGQLDAVSPHGPSQSMFPQMQRPKQSGWHVKGVSPHLGLHFPSPHWQFGAQSAGQVMPFSLQPGWHWPSPQAQLDPQSEGQFRFDSPHCCSQKKLPQAHICAQSG